MRSHNSVALPLIATLLATVLLALWLTGQWVTSTHNSKPFRVGVLGSEIAQVTTEAIRTGALDSRRFRVAYFSNTDEAIRAYRNGLIDAVSLEVEDFLQLLQSDPGHRAVLVLNHLPQPRRIMLDSALLGSTIPIAHTVLVTQQTTLRAKRLRIRSFATGWLTAAEKATDSPKVSHSWLGAMISTSKASEYRHNKQRIRGSQHQLSNRQVNRLLLRGASPLLELQLQKTAEQLLRQSHLQFIPKGPLSTQLAMDKRR